jgi:hypothetical protein
MQKDIAQLPLPLDGEIWSVHCFFNCPYVARSTDPQAAHDLMERHYTEKHSQQIARIIGPMKRRM